MGKQRKEHPQDSIFANNPFLDGLFDWMDSPEGQQCIAVRDVLWDLLEDVQLDAKQRTLIWPDPTSRVGRLMALEKARKCWVSAPAFDIVVLNDGEVRRALS